MNFRVDKRKATHSVARLLKQSGGLASILRIAKLAYLADRESIRTRSVPIIGGTYFSLPKGPMTSEVADLMNGKLHAEEWRQFISRRSGNEIKLLAEPSFCALSEAELDILDRVVLEHKDKTTEELVEWCHKNCLEFEEVSGRSSKSIHVERILEVSGKTPKQIRKVIETARVDAELEALLA